MAMAAPLLLLALDQGTSSSRAALFDTDGRPVASASAPLEIHYPADGWVEQSPTAIWESQRLAMSRLEQAITPEQRQAVISCGITNQRETTTLWKRSDGSPCGPALVWQDGRTADLCEQWKASGLETSWRAKTGLMLDPYFSASKIRWLLDHETAASSAAAQGDLCFGTVESWLLWQLSGGTIHATDMSNASRTLLMDLERRQWIDDACAEIGLPKQALPELRPCRGDFGVIQAGLPFAGVPIQALLGDQQAATLGQLCLQPGEGKCTYGTGAFLVVNTGSSIRHSDAGLLSTLGWTDEHGTPTYCLEGSLFNAGTVVQWLRDGLGIIDSAKQSGELAAQADDNQQVYMIPAFTGLGAPWWDADARGALIGLTRGTGPAEISRAALESVCYQTLDLLKAMQADWQQSGDTVLRVDGGMVASDWTMQRLADILQSPVDRPIIAETTALGAAWLAGSRAGVWPDQQGFAASWQLDKNFAPQMPPSERDCKVAGWDNAVKRVLTQ